MDKVAAIEAFVAQQDFEEKLVAVARAIASQSPRAVLFFWETDTGYGWTTLPFSHALADGLTRKAHDLIVEGEEDMGDDDDDPDAA